MSYFGKYMGYIRAVDDPEGRGRIRVFCPEVMGSTDNADHWLDWALPCFPWFTDLGVGLNFVPEKTKDWAAWVEFRQGDTQQPIWVGLFPLVKVNKDNTTISAEESVKLIVANALLRVRAKSASQPIQAGSESADEAVLIGTSYRQWEGALMNGQQAILASMGAAAVFSPAAVLVPGLLQLAALLTQYIGQAAALNDFLSKVLFTELE